MYFQYKMNHAHGGATLHCALWTRRHCQIALNCTYIMGNSWEQRRLTAKTSYKVNHGQKVGHQLRDVVCAGMEDPVVVSDNP